MDIQFILRDKFRLAVLEDLSNGEASAERVAKRNHLPAPAVDRAVRELRAEEIIGGPESQLYLTDQGKELLRQVRGLDQASSPPAAAARSRPPDQMTGEDNRKRRENQGA